MIITGLILWKTIALKPMLQLSIMNDGVCHFRIISTEFKSNKSSKPFIIYGNF